MKRLFLFDVDSTLINEEVIDLIAAHAGVQKKVSDITARAMAGEIDFDSALTERVGLLAGMPASILNVVSAEITLTNGASELIAQLHAKGDHVAVVSGGFSEVISPLMQLLSIDNFKANSLEIVGDQLTGKTKGEIVNRNAKATYLQELTAKLAPTQTIAIGDGANDISMIELADLGIAFCAKPALNQVADLVIEKRDLREILNFL